MIWNVLVFILDLVHILCIFYKNCPPFDAKSSNLLCSGDANQPIEYLSNM